MIFHNQQASNCLQSLVTIISWWLMPLLFLFKDVLRWIVCFLWNIPYDTEIFWLPTCLFIDICSGCSSLQPTDSYELWLWWKNHSVGCEFLVSLITLNFLIIFYFSEHSYFVIIDMGRYTYPDIWYFTFQAGRWEVFTVSAW